MLRKEAQRLVCAGKMCFADQSGLLALSTVNCLPYS